MPVETPVATNFLYTVTYGSNTARWTNIAEAQDFEGESHRLMAVSHSTPKFSVSPQDAEIDLTIHESNEVADLSILGPPPFQVILRIYEYDRVADTATPYWTGWIIRPQFNPTGSIVGFHSKTLWHFFERESFTDSLSALSRYSVYDPRSGVDIESLRVTITVDAFNDERDILTVSGITEPDDWFKGGLIIAPDRDMRTIIEHKTEGGLKKLYLSGAFPLFTLDTGFSADIYPGDDLTYDTWANKFGAQTNNGETFGGWTHMPNVDPETRGVI